MDSSTLLSGKELKRSGNFAAGLTLVVLGIVMGSPLGKRVALPGPLSTNHAHLASSCESCHPGSSDAFQSPLHGLEVSALDQAQSQLCLKCHPWGKDALRAHGWSEKRETRHLKKHPRANSKFGPRVPKAAEGMLACSVCHVEHAGREQALARLGNASCQTCHHKQIDSFGREHPEFEHLGLRTPGNLSFDHVRHFKRHFTGEEAGHAPTACADCHAPAGSSGGMQVASFESACGACHAPLIWESGLASMDSLALLGLPALDSMTLEEHELGIGDWPADSELTENPLSPSMEHLLRRDASLREDLDRVAECDLLDLSEAPESTLNSVVRVAWAIKQLFFELEHTGHAALELGGQAQPSETTPGAALFAGLPESLGARANQLWLPHLEAELAAHRAGEFVPTNIDVESEAPDIDVDAARAAWLSQGGWFLQGLEYDLRYRPVRHGDALLRAWIEISLGTDARALQQLVAQPESVGHCTKCHNPSAIGTPEGWHAELAERRARSMEVFDHEAHFPLERGVENACARCHKPADEETANAQQARRSSDFWPLQKSTCASCHSEDAAPVDCLSCHRYHPVRGRHELPSSRLDALFQGELSGLPRDER